MTARAAALGGAGPPVALIHGFGSDRLSWSAQVPALAPRAALIAVELPGHGGAGPVPADASPAGLARLAAAALEGLPAPMPVVGHSLGGAVALHLAAQRPDLVSRLMLIAPAGWGAALDAAFLRGLPEARDGSEAQALLARLVATPRFLPPGLGAQLLAGLSAERRDGWRRIAEALLAAAPPPHPVLPATLIWGEADAINPFDPARDLPGPVHLVAGAGHLPHVERAGPTNRLIAAALD